MWSKFLSDFHIFERLFMDLKFPHLGTLIMVEDYMTNNLKKIAVIGMRHDLGQNRRGVDMGPSAIRFANLNPQLKELGFEIQDHGDINCCTFETGIMGDPKARFLHDIVKHCSELRDHVREVVSENFFPLILGGDHSITMGVIAGVVSHFRDIGLIYMDAHGDFNTPETSPTGNIHGMSLAAITGRGHSLLTNLAGKVPMIEDNRVVLLGVRKLDSEEKRNLRESDITVFTIKDIDERGISEVMKEAITIVSRNSPVKKFHFSLDVDSIEPSVAPGTGTTVSGGLTYREAHLACELIAESKKMISMDIVEVNPILDLANQTGKLAVELILSSLGKRIL